MESNYEVKDKEVDDPPENIGSPIIYTEDLFEQEQTESKKNACDSPNKIENQFDDEASILEADLLDCTFKQNVLDDIPLHPQTHLERTQENKHNKRKYNKMVKSKRINFLEVRFSFAGVQLI